MKVGVFGALAMAALALGACATQPKPQEITLTAKNMSFTPSSFEVEAGVPVILSLDNQDALEHDFSILEIAVESVSEPDVVSAEHQMEMGNEAMEPELHVAVKPSETNLLTFTPTKPGTYEFYCTVPGHNEAGMVGTMVVGAP
jgi:uncharacterized cupredoxin-like copper-binding protein